MDLLKLAVAGRCNDKAREAVAALLGSMGDTGDNDDDDNDNDDPHCSGRTSTVSSGRGVRDAS